MMFRFIAVLFALAALGEAFAAPLLAARLLLPAAGSAGTTGSTNCCSAAGPAIVAVRFTAVSGDLLVVVAAAAVSSLERTGSVVAVECFTGPVIVSGD